MRPIPVNRPRLLRMPLSNPDAWVIDQVFDIDTSQPNCMGLAMSSWIGPWNSLPVNAVNFRKSEGVIQVCRARHLAFECNFCKCICDRSDFIDLRGNIRDNCGCVWRDEFPTCEKYRKGRKCGRSVDKSGDNCDECQRQVDEQARTKAIELKKQEHKDWSSRMVDRGVFQVCKKCRNSQPVSLFVGARMQKTSWCIDCLEKQREKGRLFYERHRHEVLSVQKQEDKKIARRKAKYASEKRCKERAREIEKVGNHMESAKPRKSEEYSQMDYLAMFPIQAITNAKQKATT